MSAATLTRELVLVQARALKLPGIARTFDGLVRQARDAHWPHEDYLHEVLSAEQASRHESVIRQRLREARFLEVKTLDTFDFAAAEGLNATQVHTLARGEWVTAPENLIFAGPIGTGKTHLAMALGVEATKQKRRVCFTRAAQLVRQLVEARDRGSSRACSSGSSGSISCSSMSSGLCPSTASAGSCCQCHHRPV